MIDNYNEFNQYLQNELCNLCITKDKYLKRYVFICNRKKILYCKYKDSNRLGLLMC